MLLVTLSQITWWNVGNLPVTDPSLPFVQRVSHEERCAVRPLVVSFASNVVIVCTSPGTAPKNEGCVPARLLAAAPRGQPATDYFKEWFSVH